jgi:hypothetical protein
MNINRVGILICLMAFSLHASAQKKKPNTEKGIFFIKGGSSGQLSLEEGKPFQVNVGVGYFFMQNAMAGVDLGYEKAGPFDDFYARPFARYYMFRRIFGGAGVRAVQPVEGKIKYIPDLEAGLALFLDSFIAFEPTVHYPIEDGSKPYFSLNISIFFSKF